MRPRGIFAIGLLFFFPSLSAADDSKSARELYSSLNDLRLNASAVYAIPAASRIELRRGDVQITFEEGRIGFFSTIDGRVTGAVFSGRAHILAAPRDPVEKQQLALFTGAPILDQSVASAYFRYTDDTDAELLRQFQTAGIAAHDDLNFVSRWDALLPTFNPLHSLRILSELLTEKTHPYFYAAMEGLSTGPFDFVFDAQREEQVFLGQVHKSENSSNYDAWVSYRVPDAVPHIPSFRPVSYALDTKIQPDMTLTASAVLRIRAETGGERFLFLQLSRDLQIRSVTSENGRALEFFQNEGMSAKQRELKGNDELAVVLPAAPKKGEEVLLTFQYSGRVIRDSGNGVFFVGARESWYPHLGDAADFALYEITMHWPRKLKLAATGTKLGEKEEGDSRVGRWKTESPAAVAGFNLGEYAFASVAGISYSVDVYANRQLEMALERRLHLPEDDFGASIATTRRSGPGTGLSLPSSQPSPADTLKHLAREIDSSIRFYEGFAGPFPFRQLSVSQIPGTFGQGWPGLLYLSTYSFLPAAAQEQAGLSTASQEHFSELVPFHEVAHQWWGNVVGWSSYRDQWIDEAFANYFALLFADSQKTPDRKMRIWLERYRNKLEEKLRDSQLTAADIGSLALGNRLTSSKAPDGFEILIYSKGAWTIHMIREMLRQPGSKNTDARFQSFLKNLFTTYSYKGLSTEDLLRELNAVMTPAMDLDGNHSMEWFIEDWVRGVGVPHYYAEYTTRKTEKGFQVKGKLYQTRVPRGFVAPVPIYSSAGVYLGRVIAGGQETQFHLNAASDPGKLQIDPHMTLLCVVDKEKPKSVQN
jgi:Peptidase family M1 domain